MRELNVLNLTILGLGERTVLEVETLKPAEKQLASKTGVNTNKVKVR